MALTLDNIIDICSGAMARQMELRQSLNLLPYVGAPGYCGPEEFLTRAEGMVEYFLEDSDDIIDKFKTLLLCTTDGKLSLLAAQIIKLEDTNVLQIMVLMMHMINVVEKFTIAKNSQFNKFVLHIINTILDYEKEEDLELPVNEILSVDREHIVYLDRKFNKFFSLFTN